MIESRRQGDLAAQIGCRDLQAKLALMLGQATIHRVDEQKIRLPRLQPRFNNALPKLPRIDFAYGLPVLWALQGEGRSGAHGLHEFVGDVDAMVQIEALAVEVSRGFADFQELLDFRVMDVEIDRCRTAPQRA